MEIHGHLWNPTVIAIELEAIRNLIRLQVAQRLLQRTRDMLGVEATEAEDQDNYVLAVWQFLVFDNEEIISEMFGHGFWSGVGHRIIFQSTGWAKCCLAEVHGAIQLWGALYMVKGVFLLLALGDWSRYTENRKSSESQLVMKSLQRITCHDIRQTNISSKCSSTNRHWND